MANTATIYDLTTKEFFELGKVGDGFFTDAGAKDISQFLTRISIGHKLEIHYDSKGNPEGFYDEGEYEKWKEYTPMLNSDKNAQESDTTKVESSNAADPKKDSWKEILEKEFPLTGNYDADVENIIKREGANWAKDYYEKEAVEPLRDEIKKLKAKNINMQTETQFAGYQEQYFSETPFAGKANNGIYSISEEALNCFFRHQYQDYKSLQEENERLKKALENIVALNIRITRINT